MIVASHIHLFAESHLGGNSGSHSALALLPSRSTIFLCAIFSSIFLKERKPSAILFFPISLKEPVNHPQDQVCPTMVGDAAGTNVEARPLFISVRGRHFLSHPRASTAHEISRSLIIPGDISVISNGELAAHCLSRSSITFW